MLTRIGDLCEQCTIRRQPAHDGGFTPCRIKRLSKQASAGGGDYESGVLLGIRCTSAYVAMGLGHATLLAACLSSMMSSGSATGRGLFFVRTKAVRVDATIHPPCCRSQIGPLAVATLVWSTRPWSGRRCLPDYHRTKGRRLSLACSRGLTGAVRLSPLSCWCCLANSIAV